MKVLMGREESQLLWCLLGWLFLLVLGAGDGWIEKVIEVADRFSSIPERRCLMRWHSWLVPGADIGQLGTGGMPAKPWPVGRKRSLMANFAER
jgi:hypothetical protein